MANKRRRLLSHQSQEKTAVVKNSTNSLLVKTNNTKMTITNIKYVIMNKHWTNALWTLRKGNISEHKTVNLALSPQFKTWDLRLSESVVSTVLFCSKTSFFLIRNSELSNNHWTHPVRRMIPQIFPGKCGRRSAQIFDHSSSYFGPFSNLQSFHEFWTSRGLKSWSLTLIFFQSTNQ